MSDTPKQLGFIWMRGFGVGASMGAIDQRDQTLPPDQQKAFNDGHEFGKASRVLARITCERQYDIRFRAITT